MNKIRQGDEVIVIAGRDKGKRGIVQKLAVHKKSRDKRMRALVEGINLVSKHVRPNPNKGEQGGIVKRESFIDLSNIALWNPMTKKADRVGIKFLEDGTKVRYFKSNDEVIDI